MSLVLSQEVWGHAPADLTSAELVVLLAIAQGAQEHDRTDKVGRFWAARTWGGDLPGHARMTSESLRKVLQRLGNRGLECRVAIKYRETAAGLVPVYAYRGTATTYRLPHLAKAGRESRQSETPDALATPSRVSPEPNAGNTARESREQGPRKPGPDSRPKGKNQNEQVSAAPRCDAHDKLLTDNTCDECRSEAEEQWAIYMAETAA